MPGQGALGQIQDHNGGIPPSGLFWTVPIPPGCFSITDDRSVAEIWVKDLCLVDTTFFSGTNIQPSTVNFHVRWEATGPAEELGQGLDVDPTDKAAFRGPFSPAVAKGEFFGKEVGFSFESTSASSSPLGHAQVGWERNGEFLADSV